MRCGFLIGILKAGAAPLGGGAAPAGRSVGQVRAVARVDQPTRRADGTEFVDAPLSWCP